MAINVSALSSYVDEQRLPLIRKTIFAAPSVKHFNLQKGVKHAAALNILSTDIVLGNGAACGWNEAGASTFSQRVLEVGNYKVNMSFCDKVLLDKWAGYEVRVAAGEKNLPFEEAFTEDIVKGVGREIERIAWQGVKAQDRADGILTILAAEAEESGSTIAIEGESGATAYQDVLAIYENIPVEVLDKAAIFVGMDTFRSLVLDLTLANLYHYDPKVDDAMQIVLPGTNTKVYGVAGLNGTKKIVAADPENIFYGVDMEGDEEKFDLWYSKDNQEFRASINFNAGFQVAFPEQCKVLTRA